MIIEFFRKRKWDRSGRLESSYGAASENIERGRASDLPKTQRRSPPREQKAEKKQKKKKPQDTPVPLLAPCRKLLSLNSLSKSTFKTHH